MSRLRLVWTGAVVLCLVPFASPASAQDAADFYEENCAACHTLGDGGPLDLKGVTARKDRAWLVRFILDPEAVVRSGDPYARQLVEQAGGGIMPSIDDLTPDLAAQILDHIEHVTGLLPAAPAAAPSPVDEPFTGVELSAGRALYSGERRLAAGGPSCFSCHRLAGTTGPGGGVFGPDLTNVHQRLRGRRGLDAWLTSPPTPVMRAVYRRAALRDDERRALIALFEHAAAEPARPSGSTATFLVAGAGGAVIALAAMALVWSRRFRGVRRPMLAASLPRSPGDQR